jgi:hypothetical protein
MAFLGNLLNFVCKQERIASERFNVSRSGDGQICEEKFVIQPSSLVQEQAPTRLAPELKVPMFLSGILWTLHMYITGTCPDFYFNYQWFTAPSRVEIVDFCKPPASSDYNVIIAHMQLQPTIPQSTYPPLPAAVVSAILLQSDCVHLVPPSSAPLITVFESLAYKNIGYIPLLTEYHRTHRHEESFPYSIELQNRNTERVGKEGVDWLPLLPVNPKTTSKFFDITRPLHMQFVTAQPASSFWI